MRIRLGLAGVSLLVATIGCSGSGKTLMVHVPYSENEGLINQVLGAHFGFCSESSDNRIKLVIDNIPPGSTVAHPGLPDPIPQTSVWECSDMLED